MIKKAYSVLLFSLFFSSVLHAQDGPKLINEPVTEEVIEVIEFEKLKTPQSEVEDAILFLSKLPSEDAQFIRFFSTYAVPAAQREDEVLVLSFIIHSLIGISDDPDTGNAGAYYPLAVRDDDDVFKTYRQVPGSDTLWWIDLREYNWTAEAWETISDGDGYFAEPIVTADRSGALRLLAGNAIVRSDWFLHHAMSTTAQLDLGKDINFYDTLLYAKATKAPSTIEEFRQAWGLDLTKARKLGNEYGTLVTKSKAVATRNRMLFGYRTELGYLYETYDVNFQNGKRDYLESIFLNKRIGGPPDVSDAGEVFASNMVGLQVYALRDAAGDLVEFGDPTVVRHMEDVLSDPRVRVAHSCLDCHASGPIPSENTLDEFIRANANLKTYDKADALRINRTLLSDKFEDSIADNQVLFARAVKKTNGLTPTANGSKYLQRIIRYNRSINLEIAAYECGTTPEELRTKIMESQYRFGARLKLLVTTGELIPRDVWEAPSVDGIPGGFQQAMIMLNGLTIVEEEDPEIQVPVEEVIIQDEVVEAPPIIEEVINPLRDQITILQVSSQDAELKAGTTTLLTPAVGYRLFPTGEVSGSWIQVYAMDGKLGYIRDTMVEEISVDVREVEGDFSSLSAEKLEELINAASKTEE